jgi:ectoine hydroxylase-related dioxygenase (phytanoyl-CoA dioxygenase family)
MGEASPRVLGADEIAAYQRDGFVVPRWRLPHADLARLQRLTERLCADNPHLVDTPLTCPHVPGSGVQRLKSSPEWLELSTHSGVLDMVEQLLGPDLILWGSNLFYKRPVEGPATPWHRDGAHWVMRPLVTTSVWIAITDSRLDNGCLRFIPGSHANGEMGEHYDATEPGLIFPGSIRAEEFDETQAVDVEVEAGQMVLFSAYTIHGARANRGTRPRGGYSLRYMPATSRFHHDMAVRRDTPGSAQHTRPLILVRGVDRAGNDFKRGHPADLAAA